MYESFIGKKLLCQEIFEQLPNLAVLGEPDSSEFPTIYFTIRHVGPYEDMEELRNTTTGMAIYHGKHSRKGVGGYMGEYLFPARPRWYMARICHRRR